MSINKELGEDLKGQDYVDFVRGQSDCDKGIPHKSGQGEYYDRGYSAQYELEQVAQWI